MNINETIASEQLPETRSGHSAGLRLHTHLVGEGLLRA